MSFFEKVDLDVRTGCWHSGVLLVVAPSLMRCPDLMGKSRKICVLLRCAYCYHLDPLGTCFVFLCQTLLSVGKAGQSIHLLASCHCRPRPNSVFSAWVRPSTWLMSGRGKIRQLYLYCCIWKRHVFGRSYSGLAFFADTCCLTISMFVDEMVGRETAGRN